jgi:hypothetical protein
MPDGDDITAALFRDVNIRSLLEAAVEWQAITARAIAGLVSTGEGWEDTPAGGRVFRDVHHTGERVQALRRQWTMTDENLRRVADVYLSDGTGAPIVAVMGAFHAKRRTASRWVAKAREEGFIPPSSRSRGDSNG